MSGGTLQLGNPPITVGGTLGSGPIVGQRRLAPQRVWEHHDRERHLRQRHADRVGLHDVPDVDPDGEQQFQRYHHSQFGATLQVGSGGTAGTLGSGGVSGSGTLAFDFSSTLTVSNVLSGSLNVVQEGSGVLVLTGLEYLYRLHDGQFRYTLRLGGSSVLPDGSSAAP